MTDHVTAKVETITPEMAEKWLTTMVTNRTPSEARVLEYAIQIDEDKWSLNGESIKFDAQGRLFDGQHRLRACVLAEKPFRSLVARGMDEGAFKTVDTGKTRTHADMFSVAGWAQNKNAASTAFVLYLIAGNKVGWKGPTGARVQRGANDAISAKIRSMPTATSNVSREELLKFAEPLRDEITIALRFANACPARRLVPIPIIAALYHLFRAKNLAEAERMFNDLGTGLELVRDDPVYALRERLISTRDGELKMRRWAVIGLLILCWNKRRAGERCKQLRVSDSEAFPKVR